MNIKTDVRAMANADIAYAVSLAVRLSDELECDGVDVDWIQVLTWARETTLQMDLGHPVAWVIGAAMDDDECYRAAKSTLGGKVI